MIPIQYKLHFYAAVLSVNLGFFSALTLQLFLMLLHCKSNSFISRQSFLFKRIAPQPTPIKGVLNSNFSPFNYELNKK